MPMNRPSMGVGFGPSSEQLAVGGFSIASAIFGGALGALSAYQRGKAIEEAAILTQRRINLEIQQARYNEQVETEALARQTQRELGAIFVQSPDAQGNLDAVVSALVDPFSARETIREQRRRFEEAAMYEKEAVVAGAEAEMPNIGVAMASGISSGLQFGLGLEAAFRSLKAGGQINDLEAAILEQSLQVGGVELEVLKARLVTEKAQLDWVRSREADLAKRLGNWGAAQGLPRSGTFSRPADRGLGGLSIFGPNV